MRYTRLVAGETTTAADVLAGLDLAARAPAERPYAFISMVSTADGRAIVDGKSESIGSDADTEMLLELRVLPDAIFVGTGTMRVESYTRPVAGRDRARRRVEQGRAASPLVVCSSSRGEIPWEVPLFSDPEARVLVFADGTTPPPRTTADVTVLPHAPLDAIFRQLRRDHGVRVLMVEGGPTVNRAVVGAGLADELFLTLAPTLAAGQVPGILSGDAVSPPLPMQLAHVLRSQEGELFLRYVAAP